MTESVAEKDLIEAAVAELNQKLLDLNVEAVLDLKPMDLTETVVEKDLIEAAVAELNQKVLDLMVEAVLHLKLMVLTEAVVEDLIDLYLADQKKSADEKDSVEAAVVELNQKLLDLMVVADLHLKLMMAAVAVGKNLFEADEVVLDDHDHDSVSCED